MREGVGKGIWTCKKGWEGDWEIGEGGREGNWEMREEEWDLEMREWVGD